MIPCLIKPMSGPLAGNRGPLAIRFIDGKSSAQTNMMIERGNRIAINVGVIDD